jgi:hypothetical protein
MSIYFFGPEKGRIVSKTRATRATCMSRTRGDGFADHYHVTLMFDHDQVPCGDACEFRLKADGGWQEIESAIEGAPEK